MSTLPKPPERRQRRNHRGAELVRPDDAPLLAPPAPDELSPTLRAAWDAYWSSGVARLVEPSDVPALARLFELYEERARALAMYRDEPVMEGSTGQAVLSPFGAEVASLDKRVAELEDRFGLSPRARLQLGVTFGEAFRSLDDLNRKLTSADDDDDDPRITFIDETPEAGG